MKSKTEYQVIVGNVGTVYSGKNKVKAEKTYDTYKAISIAGVGRAGGEDVTLMVTEGDNQDIVKEHAGHLQVAEDI